MGRDSCRDYVHLDMCMGILRDNWEGKGLRPERENREMNSGGQRLATVWGETGGSGKGFKQQVGR